MGHAGNLRVASAPQLRSNCEGGCDGDGGEEVQNHGDTEVVELDHLREGDPGEAGEDQSGHEHVIDQGCDAVTPRL
ncbi:MAG: hypothetical protein FJ037_09255 [Chloroflexi bacterium]|nr:hypothetical protein [Chloroflexota bacterium]